MSQLLRLCLLRRFELCDLQLLTGQLQAAALPSAAEALRLAEEIEDAEERVV